LTLAFLNKARVEIDFAHSKRPGHTMRGQWMGTFKATNWHGNMTVEADDFGGKMGGTVYMFPPDVKDPRFTIVVGEIVPIAHAPSPVVALVNLSPLNPITGTLVPWPQIPQVFPGVEFAKHAQATIEWTDDEMTVTWDSNIGTGGRGTLTRSDAARASNLPSQQMDWKEFREHVTSLEDRKYVFRGQKKPWRLRSHFHRTGRNDLIRYITSDMTLLHRHLSARTRHLFDRSNSDENGALLHLAQHHGFPTPLIDWTYSPFVAAFFAYRNITNEDAKTSTEHVRVFQFDQQQWREDVPQIAVPAPAHPHFSLMEFVAVENERLIPQQALSGLTNVDDVETYIASVEKNLGRQYLTAIDMPIAEREEVMRQLALMGITAGSLFPGLDGACEELRERLFPS
jgi:FRG domain